MEITTPHLPLPQNTVPRPAQPPPGPSGTWAPGLGLRTPTQCRKVLARPSSSQRPSGLKRRAESRERLPEGGQHRSSSRHRQVKCKGSETSPAQPSAGCQPPHLRPHPLRCWMKHKKIPQWGGQEPGSHPQAEGRACAVTKEQPPARKRSCWGSGPRSYTGAEAQRGRGCHTVPSRQSSARSRLRPRKTSTGPPTGKSHPPWTTCEDRRAWAPEGTTERPAKNGRAGVARGRPQDRHRCPPAPQHALG